MKLPKRLNDIDPETIFNGFLIGTGLFLISLIGIKAVNQSITASVIHQSRYMPARDIPRLERFTCSVSDYCKNKGKNPSDYVLKGISNVSEIPVKTEAIVNYQWNGGWTCVGTALIPKAVAQECAKADIEEKLKLENYQKQKLAQENHRKEIAAYRGYKDRIFYISGDNEDDGLVNRGKWADKGLLGKIRN